MSTPKNASSSRPRPNERISRTVAWVEQQLTEQNQMLREALEDAPEFAQVLASECRPTTPSTRARIPPLGTGRA